MTIPETAVAMTVEPVPPDLAQYDFELLEDLLSMHTDGLPITWPEGLNHCLAAELIQRESKRRRT